MGMLTQFDEDYAGTEAAKGGGSRLPDGTYEAEVTSCMVGRSKFDSEVVQLQWAFRVKGGDHDGRFTWKDDNIEAKRLPYIKKDLEAVGLTLAKFSDLENRAQEVEGSTVEIGVKSNYVEARDKTYTNVYINKLLSPPAASDAVPADDDDIPL